MRLGFTLLI